MELSNLVVASGPSQTAVQILLDNQVKNYGNTHLQEQPIPIHRYRGWSLLPANSATPVHTEIDEVMEQRPFWLLFPGIVRDWYGVAEGMMQVPAFAKSMQRSADVLQPFGIDLFHIVNHVLCTDKLHLLASFVVTTAIQVALIDVVRLLELHVDGLLGVGAGDFACGYADGTLSSEQAVLVSYWNARCMLDAPIEATTLAKIHLSWQECEAKCPPGIKLSVQMDKSNIYVSGPENAVAKFVAELESTGIKTEHKAEYAFHCDYLAAAASLLKPKLETLIPYPKQRSARWLSASVTRAHREKYTSKLCDANFYVYEMVAPVMFVEAVAEIPENAIIVEVGPKLYFQQTLRQLKPNAVNISLLHHHPVSTLYPLLSAIGRMYIAGANPKLSALFKS